MKKWRLLAITEYFIPWVLVMVTGLFTKWGHDIENCIFAFFIGLLIQCIIGVCGVIGIRKEVDMDKERKLFLVSIFPLFFIILLFLLRETYGGYSMTESKDGSDASGSVVSVSDSKNDKLSPDLPEDISARDVKKLMEEIDSRVKEVKDKINYEWRETHYEGDILMFQCIERGDDEHENYAVYYLYYDKQGKLIYVEITHYRAAAYSIYFHNDELLHMESGPFYEGGVSINGNMKDVKDIVKKEPDYAFVLEDISLCLENAYKNQ